MAPLTAALPPTPTDVARAVTASTVVGEAASPLTLFSRAAIEARMPIGAPFLFLDEARIGADVAHATYRITGEEFFLAGHFKDNPVMPASIMLEALGQLGVLHLLTGLPVAPGKAVDPSTIFLASTDGVRCQRVCRPGDELTLQIAPKRIKAPLAVYTGNIRVRGEKAVAMDEFTLTFRARDASL